jgi:hypothetical protein
MAALLGMLGWTRALATYHSVLPLAFLLDQMSQYRTITILAPPNDESRESRVKIDLESLESPEMARSEIQGTPVIATGTIPAILGTTGQENRRDQTAPETFASHGCLKGLVM